MILESQLGGAAPARQLRVSPEATEVGRARRWATRTGFHLGADDDTVEIVRILVSELVTNLVLHAGTDGCLSLSVTGPTLHLSLADGSAAATRTRRLTEEATTGRGLHLLTTLTTDHGVRASDVIAPDGKEVWCTLPLRSASGSPGADVPAVGRLGDRRVRP